MESPVVIKRKIANKRLTQLKIKEERNLGSLTCHVYRFDAKPVYKHFVANSSTEFGKPGTYDPYR